MNEFGNLEEWETFQQVPIIAMALVKSPEDLMVWLIFKEASRNKFDISSKNLAILASMSEKKVSKAVERLIDVGLIKCTPDPDFPGSETLHITDIWDENDKWLKEHRTIESRIGYMLTKESH